MHEKRFIFFVSFLLLGIILAVQFRSTFAANKTKNEAALNYDKLKAQYEEELNMSNVLNEEVNDLMRSNENLIVDYIVDKRDENLKNEWEMTRLIAGLTDVKGNGVIIKIDDADRDNYQGSSDSLLVHEQDVQSILNELKKAGAQAISINGERITAISEQVCAGPTILVNRNRYSVPYVIEAIGNPDNLYNSLVESEYLHLMIRDKIKVDFKKSNDILIPKFRNRLENHISGLEVLKNEVK